jgi:TPR repeat protein
MRLDFALNAALKTLIISVLIMAAICFGFIVWFCYALGSGWGEAAQRVDALAKAAVNGDEDAQFKLAKLTLSTPSGERAMLRAANAGDRMSQACLGEAYHEGFGILPQDDVEAERWFAKAAEGVNAFGQTGLGRAYYFGWGVAKNDVEAVRLWKLAVIQNDSLAQALLAYAYAEGIGGLQVDEPQAVTLARASAERGNVTGQTMLGSFYVRGIGGLLQDVTQAYIWYSLAAKQGDAAGITMREKLKNAMTQKEVADAERLAKAWQPQ